MICEFLNCPSRRSIGLNNAYDAYVDALPAVGLAAVDGDEVLARLERLGNSLADRHQFVLGDVAVDAGSSQAVNVNLGVLVVV